MRRRSRSLRLHALGTGLRQRRLARGHCVLALLQLLQRPAHVRRRRHRGQLRRARFERGLALGEGALPVGELLCACLGRRSRLETCVDRSLALGECALPLGELLRARLRDCGRVKARLELGLAPAVCRLALVELLQARCQHPRFGDELGLAVAQGALVDLQVGEPLAPRLDLALAGRHGFLARHDGLEVDPALVQLLLDLREAPLAIGQLVGTPVGRLGRFRAGACGRLRLRAPGLELALLLDQRLLARGEPLRLRLLLLRLPLELGYHVFARGHVLLTRDQLLLVDAAPLELGLRGRETALACLEGGLVEPCLLELRLRLGELLGPLRQLALALGQLRVVEAALRDLGLRGREPLRLLGQLALALGDPLLLDAALLQLPFCLGEQPLALDKRRDLQPALGELLL